MKNIQVSIRIATEADIDVIKQLDKETVLNIAREVGKTDSELKLIAKNHSRVFQEYFDLKTQKIWLAEMNKKIVGFIWLIESVEQFTGKPYGFIMDIGVIEKYRKKGIGRKLLAFAEEYCRQKGFKCIKLMVNSRNKSALDFYRKHKFEVENLYMRKNLCKF
jgi:ribosomal protein S18 acetylase RimI-like enzyme